jgi:hypothetical protein
VELVCGLQSLVQFDRSRSTRIGKYVINHSFILPGLTGVSTSCLLGYLLAVTRGSIYAAGGRGVTPGPLLPANGISLDATHTL